METLTDRSAVGTYVVVTASKSVYEVTISADHEPEVIRRPLVSGLLLDGEPMTGVTRFDFDSRTGFGQIRWTKADPADYDDPSQPYTGTGRTTSRDLVIAEMAAAAESIDVIRNAVLASGDHDELHAAVRELIGG